MFLYDDDDDDDDAVYSAKGIIQSSIAARRAMWPFVIFLATCLFGVQQNAAGVLVLTLLT